MAGVARHLVEDGPASGASACSSCEEASAASVSVAGIACGGEPAAVSAAPSQFDQQTVHGNSFAGTKHIVMRGEYLFGQRWFRNAACRR